MLDQTAFTRRQFMNTGLAVVSTVATVPTFLHNFALAASDENAAALTLSRPGVPEDRILVVVQLSGGNDGLNTLVPYGAPEYYKARPAIAIRQNDILRVDQGQGVGLHNQLAGLKDLMDDGNASVIQGVGYPNPNRSHFASMDIWHTCQARGGKGLGWLGKALDQVAADASSAMIAIGRESPLAGQGKRTTPVSFENAELFRWTGRDLHHELGQQYDAINRAGVLSPAGAGPNPGAAVGVDDQAAFVMRTALDAQLASDRIRRAIGKGTLTDFPRGPLANQLRMVAAMIRAGLPTRVYYVGLGGFDTHGGQPFRHANLLRQFGTAMKGFYRELKALGQDGRVLSMAFSEFGRRVAQNASQGTDHGTAGPMFLFGPMVRPGVLGKHPSLTRLDDGDLIYNVDFRSVYAAALEGWLKADSQKVIGKAFKPAPVLDAKKIA